MPKIILFYVLHLLNSLSYLHFKKKISHITMWYMKWNSEFSEFSSLDQLHGVIEHMSE